MAEEIIAPNGSPLRAAVIGCRDIDKSKAFYQDRIGLSVLADRCLAARNSAGSGT